MLLPKQKRRPLPFRLYPSSMNILLYSQSWVSYSPLGGPDFSGGGAGEVFVSQAQARLSTASSTADSTAVSIAAVESGIEETSISASSVIRKFESVAATTTSEQQLRGSSSSLAGKFGGGSGSESAVAANLLQETVSSRLKKVSKEELNSSAESSGEYKERKRKREREREKERKREIERER